MELVPNLYLYSLLKLFFGHVFYAKVQKHPIHSHIFLSWKGLVSIALIGLESELLFG